VFFGGTETQGFTLYPTDEDLSVGTLALGYFHVLPNGRMEEPEGRWLGFVVSQVSKARPGHPVK
jgi:hypothetical protein